MGYASILCQRFGFLGRPSWGAIAGMVASVLFAGKGPQKPDPFADEEDEEEEENEKKDSDCENENTSPSNIV